MRRCPALLRRAVVLDIDGVIIRGPKAIAGAKAALQQLDLAGVPWMLLTNGSGPEERKAATVSGIVGFEIDPARVVVSHTPMREFDHLKHERILLSARQSGVDALKAYGFTDAVWSEDHIAHNPTQVPLRSKTNRPPRPSAIADPDPDVPYKAVAVFGEPDDWYSEIQIILDALHTHPGTNASNQPAQQIPLYWFNSDVTYSGQYHHPRLAGGSLLAALQGVHQALFSESPAKKLDVVHYGKPHQGQYAYLIEKLARLARCAARELTEVYCVGDNIWSDVAGANRAGPPFASVLVLSGIAAEEPVPGRAPQECLPDLVYPDVLAFVRDLLAAGGPDSAAAAAAQLAVVTGSECPLCDELMEILADNHAGHPV
eukprot:gene19586-30171_t